ncbi:hypothetical protein [Spirosoma aerophilum]
MRSFRIILFVIGLSLSQATRAQWRLLYKSQDIVAPGADTALSITSIESRGLFSKYLVVRSDNQPKSLVLKNAVWGYVDGNNRVWRSYDKDSYLLVKYNGGWAEYAINRFVSGTSFRTYMQPMYSRTLDSPIHSTWQAAMKDVPPSFILK